MHSPPISSKLLVSGVSEVQPDDGHQKRRCLPQASNSLVRHKPMQSCAQVHRVQQTGSPIQRLWLCRVSSLSTPLDTNRNNGAAVDSRFSCDNSKRNFHESDTFLGSFFTFFLCQRTRASRRRSWRRGWQLAKSRENFLEYALVHYNFEGSHDMLVILDLLDRIRLGIFHSVFIILPAASWSRARHADSAGQLPVRTRSQPFGVVRTTSETQARLQRENRSLDFIHWIKEQTLRCEVIRVPVVLIFPNGFRR